MKILVVGGGAREHTLVWKLAQSPSVKDIYAAPGNAGTAQIARNLDISPSDIEGLAGAAREKRIDLVVVGHRYMVCFENSMCGGFVDHGFHGGGIGTDVGNPLSILVPWPPLLDCP